MTEQAFQLRGIDGATRLPVRVELRLITDENVEPLMPETFSAPRGFLSYADATTAQTCTGAAATSTACRQAFDRSFRAPRGFLGA